MTLTALEIRILGCLLEKERLTPENYPLSLNALTNACNQSTNREPVMACDEKSVDDALLSLREKKIATVIFGAGSRVQKYRHNLPDLYELSREETALLCILLLRGPQTPGELRARTERMAGFASIDDTIRVLDGLAAGSDPLVRLLPARPGQKESRYIQLLGGEPDLDALMSAPVLLQPSSTSRIEQVQAEVAQLREELSALREEFTQFRKLLE